MSPIELSWTAKKNIVIQLQEYPILTYGLLLFCYKMIGERYSRGVKGMKNAFLRPFTMRQNAFEYQRIKFQC